MLVFIKWHVVRSSLQCTVSACDCSEFVTHVFRPSKCKNCFHSRDLHVHPGIARLNFILFYFIFLVRFLSYWWRVLFVLFFLGHFKYQWTPSTKLYMYLILCFMFFFPSTHDTEKLQINVSFRSLLSTIFVVDVKVNIL